MALHAWRTTRHGSRRAIEVPGFSRIWPTRFRANRSSPLKPARRSRPTGAGQSEWADRSSAAGVGQLELVRVDSVELESVSREGVSRIGVSQSRGRQSNWGRDGRLPQKAEHPRPSKRVTAALKCGSGCPSKSWQISPDRGAQSHNPPASQAWVPLWPAMGLPPSHRLPDRLPEMVTLDWPGCCGPSPRGISFALAIGGSTPAQSAR